MGTYIVRRLILMLPTLVGITFLVFMLIALSPGGIGASLQFSAGGSMDQTSAAERKAYLDDRYGLDDPAIVQYGRWLARISPVKFGVRDQIASDGDRIREAKAIRPPILWEWFATELPPIPEPPAFAWPDEQWQAEGLDASQIAEAKNRAYRGAKNRYAGARARYVNARSRFEAVVGEYARDEAVGLERGMTREGNVKESVFRRAGPNRQVASWPDVEAAADTMFQTHAAAQEARAEELAVFRAKPYREAGVPVVPGVMSLATPDFGKSFSMNRPVTTLIREHLPITLLLNSMAIPIIYFIAIPFGMLAAVRQGSLLDVASGAAFIALLSFPIVLAGVLAVGYLANDDYLGWFPVTGLHDAGAEYFTFLPSRGEDGAWERGYLADLIWHCCLPVMCLVYGGFAILSKQTRAAMLDNFNADYVRTAKAKGVAYKDIVFRHVFRNSLLPLITIFVSIFPAMLSGSVVIEKIFSVKGMGALVLGAIDNRDRELVLATTLMIACVNLIALLLADILYALADPRISYD